MIQEVNEEVPTTIRILVANQSPILASALTALIDSHRSFEVVARATNCTKCGRFPCKGATDLPTCTDAVSLRIGHLTFPVARDRGGGGRESWAARSAPHGRRPSAAWPLHLCDAARGGRSCTLKLAGVKFLQCAGAFGPRSVGGGANRGSGLGQHTVQGCRPAGHTTHQQERTH